MVEKLHEAGHATSMSGRPASDILSKIIDKERELEMSVLEAQEEANRIIQRAREKAAETTAQHRKKAEAEAVTAKQEIIARARQNAEQVKTSFAGQINQLKEIPADRLNKTVDRLLAMLLPQ